MQADCRDTLGGLSDQISAGMGIIFSNFDNREGKIDFELDKGQATEDTCDDAKSIINNF